MKNEKGMSLPRRGNAMTGMRAVTGMGRSSPSQHRPITSSTYRHLQKYLTSAQVIVGVSTAASTGPSPAARTDISRNI